MSPKADRAEPDSGRILELLDLLPSFALRGGLQPEVFTHLAAGPSTAADLGRVLGVRHSRLERLLYALAAADLLEITGADADGANLFANSPEADHFLVAGRPEFIGHERELWSRVWSASLQTAASVRADSPQALLDFQTMDREDLRTFLQGLHAGAVETGTELAAGWLAPHRNVLDVGGGSGGLAVAFARVCPEARVTVLELPEVAPVTRAIVAAEASSAPIEVLGTHMGRTDRQPIDDLEAGSFDAAVCKSFLQCLGPAEAETAVAQIARLLRPAGELLVIGVGILDESRVTPKHSALFNLIFLNIYTEGRSYTESEHRSWFEAAGLVDVERLETEDGTAVLRAHKPN